MSEPNAKPEAELARILESAHRLGVNVNEADALQWLTNMATAHEGSSITMDTRSGVFGHNITMLDFSQQELEYFRRIGKLVEIELGHPTRGWSRSGYHGRKRVWLSLGKNIMGFSWIVSF